MPWVGSSQLRYTEFENPNKGSGGGVWCAACTVSLCGQNTFNICNYDGVYMY